MNSKMLGCILLIVGSALGGGMLALPITLASSGFWPSVALLVGCWLVMTMGALFILEVSLWLPENTNLSSMAKRTLGRPGQLLAWVSYLLLFYSLLSAYISGGVDVLQAFLSSLRLHTTMRWDAIFFVLAFGFVVWRGVHFTDLANRGLMLLKLAAFVMLVLVVLPHVSPKLLQHAHPVFLSGAVTVAITSFGFAGVVPSLRTYFKGDLPSLRRSIWWGSTIPLVCYILWLVAIQGSVESATLTAMIQSGHATTDLTHSMRDSFHNVWVTDFVHLFTSVCVLTSFLCVSLATSDFLADGLKLKKRGVGKLVVYAATFLPPLVIVLFAPGVFIKALSYAGIFCAILLVLLPAMMVFSGRYVRRIASGYQVEGGVPLILVEFFVALGVVLLAMYQLHLV